MAKYIDLEKVVFDLTTVAHLPPDPVAIAREFVRQLKTQSEAIPDSGMQQTGRAAYFVQISDDWEYFNAVDIPDLVTRVAEYTGNKSDLLMKALVGCAQDEDYIEMYNRFAFSYGSITGIWALGKHVFGDKN